MRVQRAPRASEQPQPAPAGYVAVRDRPTTAPGSAPGSAPVGSTPTAGASFSAVVDLDLTASLARRGEPATIAEVVVGLVAACHREGLLDDASPLRVLRPGPDGLTGVEVDGAVRQSSYAVGSMVAAPGAALGVPGAGTLSVVDLSASRVRVGGGWGVGGVGVATLGRALPVASSVALSPDGESSGDLGIGLRQVARLALTVTDPAHGSAAVRALEAVLLHLGAGGR